MPTVSKQHKETCQRSLIRMSSYTGAYRSHDAITSGVPCIQNGANTKRRTMTRWDQLFGMVPIFLRYDSAGLSSPYKTRQTRQMMPKLPSPIVGCLSGRSHFSTREPSRLD